MYGGKSLAGKYGVATVPCCWDVCAVYEAVVSTEQDLK